MRLAKPRAASVLLALTLLASASPVAASGGVTHGGDSGTTVEPTGAGACDLKLSTADTAPSDTNITIGVGEEMAVLGTGYPADSQLAVEYSFPATGEVFPDTALTDAAGEFGFLVYFTAGSEGHWVVEATFDDACTDTVGVDVITGHPFTDVGGHLFESEIAWLFQRRITTGCTPALYCPDAAVNREQMASFLVRALGLTASSPVHPFADDAGSIHRNDINRLWASGITDGCAPERFCPRDPVTREQMASFLARALNLPATDTDFFTDDSGSIHQADINRLAAAGIGTGCGGGRFCPTGVVTRGQMAAFLERALF